MNSLKLKIVRVSDDVKLPNKANFTDSGWDVYAWKFKNLYKGQVETSIDCSNNNFIDLPGGCRVLVDTGIKATVAPGWEIQVRSKSGRSLKEGLVVLNSPGTVDHQYNETIGVILANTCTCTRRINLGEKIAQLVVQKVELLDIEEVRDLDNGERSGFGSTGIK